MGENYISELNGATCSYQTAMRDVTLTILSSDDRKIWLSSSSCSFPHVLIVNLAQIKEKPLFYRAFGISCWHAYNSNPATIRLHISKDGHNFVLWQTL